MPAQRSDIKKMQCTHHRTKLHLVSLSQMKVSGIWAYLKWASQKQTYLQLPDFAKKKRWILLFYAFDEALQEMVNVFRFASTFPPERILSTQLGTDNSSSGH